MKLPRFSPLCFASALSVISVPAFAEIDFGNIAFVGDSITQADGTNAVSYRYSLWKHFVDAGISYNPQGSMNIFTSGSSTSSLAPSYLGKTFNNTSEGHFGWDAAWIVSGESQGNRPNTGQNTGGLATWIDGYDEVPDVATVLIGINDLSRGNSNSYFSNLLANQKAIVETLQSKNENINVYVFSLLPSSQTSWTHCETNESPWATVLAYNSLLKEAVKTWGTEKSTVTYADITAGFDPTNGVHTYDSLHPKAQGELLLAGNIARAFGIAQRTVGLERRAAISLASQTSFTKNGNAGVKVSVKSGETTREMENSSSFWTVNTQGNIEINTTSDTAGSDIQLTWGADSGKTHEFTFSIDVKMNAVSTDSHSTTNFLGILLGNGLDEVGALYIGESGVYWGGTAAANLLYGQSNDAYKDKFFTQSTNSFRVDWIGETETGAASGFYVWLNDQLIGEALSGLVRSDVVSSYKNSLLVGDIGSAYVTFAEISEMSFDAQKAYAPSVPEPSAFGLLAGMGAIALVVSRRRR